VREREESRLALQAETTSDDERAAAARRRRRLLAPSPPKATSRECPRSLPISRYYIAAHTDPFLSYDEEEALATSAITF
jgi:hypothetical protein